MNNKLFLFSQRLNPILTPAKELKVNEPDQPEINKDVQSLLDYIFGVDPNSGLPVGDLAIYLGKKCNPQVKEFIQSNLMLENALPDSSVNLPPDVVNKFRSVINDDDIAFFSRNHGESREEYSDRLRLYFEDQKKLRSEQRKQAILHKAYKKSKELLET